MEKAYDLAETMPFACRKAGPANPFFRELLIPFGSTGYVSLFEVENNEQLTILAARHQREDDFLLAMVVPAVVRPTKRSL